MMQILFSLILVSAFSLVSPKAEARPFQCSQLYQNFSPGIATSRTLIDSGKYVLHRSYYEYLKAFGSGFQKDLGKLGRDAVWVDMGAGAGHALRDFVEYKISRKEEFPQVIGISKQDPDFDPSLKSIEWLGGRFFEDIPSSELPSRIDIVTDYYGILSYTTQMSQYLNTVFERMPVGGKFYTFISNRDQILQGNSMWNRIANKTNLAGYLKSTANLEVTEKKIRDPFTLQTMRVLVLEKRGPVQFADLTLVNYKADTPPHRSFERR